MSASLIQEFKAADLSMYPDFYSYDKPLEMALWILWVAKEQFATKKLTTDHIAEIILEVFEISTNATTIRNAFNRASDKIHIYKETDTFCYEIMKPGKDHLLSQIKEGVIDVVYFQAGKRFTSKRLLSKNIIDTLTGHLSIVDPYCGSKTLDVLLTTTTQRKISFLTRIENLRNSEKESFLRQLQDFKTESPMIEFRNYPFTDLHDRYMISSDSLVILGHSIKDIGSKESFAVTLNTTTNKNMVDALIENFNRRWKQASVL